jgi:MraZ protein
MPTEPETSSDPIFYSSLYRHGVDEKRRVQIPAKWRTLKSEELTLILWPKATMSEACLLVLPPREWSALFEKLRAMPFYEAKAQALRHLIGRRSDRVAIDKAGRICLPDGMAKSAAIGSEVILVGLVDRFEIWDPARYESASAGDEQLLSEAFKLI